MRRRRRLAGDAGERRLTTSATTQSNVRFMDLTSPNYAGVQYTLRGIACANPYCDGSPLASAGALRDLPLEVHQPANGSMTVSAARPTLRRLGCALGPYELAQLSLVFAGVDLAPAADFATTGADLD